MENDFVKNPLKIVVYDPVNNKSVFTYVCLGQCIPKYVRNAATDYVNSKSAKDAKSLREYFGAQWQKRLGLNIMGERAVATGGVDEPPAELIDMYQGGDNVPDDIMDIIDMSDIMNEGTRTKSDADDSVRTSQVFDEIQITDKDLEFSEIASLDDVSEAIKVREFTSGIEIIDVDIFPEDKISEIKDKIHIATTIPSYRAHVFYFTNGRHQTPYQLTSNIGIHNTDIRNLTNTSDMVLNVNVDKQLYENREHLSVTAFDDFRLIGNCITDHIIYVVDIASFIQKYKSQYQQLLNDIYQIELIYYGFVIKYWPQLTRDVFNVYINNEIELLHRYPDLAPPLSLLMSRYEQQAKLLNENYRQYKRILKPHHGEIDASELIGLIKSLKLQLAITHMKVINNSKYQSINLRNLFDKLITSDEYPEVQYYAEIAHNSYQMIKKTNGSQPITFPHGIKTGVIVAINVSDVKSTQQKASGESLEVKQTRIIFLNIQSDGRYMVITNWNEEDGFDFDDVKKIIIKYVNKLLSQVINKMTRYVFGTGECGFPLLTNNNITYQSIDANVYWKKIILPHSYKTLRSAWQSYQTAGMINITGLKNTGEYEFLMQKGMYLFDTARVADVTNRSNEDIIRNQYSHLSNGAIKQKWEMLFGGRKVRIYHRTADVKFEVRGIWKSEFKLFLLYLSVFLTKLQNEKEFTKSVETTTSSVKKIRKLQEYDPELFNLKKYGIADKYSIKCQKKFQPDVYTEDEVSKMNAANRKKLIQYHNFTTNKPAYYSCSGNKRNPHITFKVDIHPKGYCMPCCKKKLSAPESKKAQIVDICLSNRVYSDKALSVKEDEHSRYVMAYGKELLPNRLSKLPNTYINELFFNSIDVIEETALQRKQPRTKIAYYVMGIMQHTLNEQNVGFIYCLADALGLSVDELIRGICAKLLRPENQMIFYSAVGNKLPKYFKSMKHLVSYIKLLFGEDLPPTPILFPLWNELFIYFGAILYKIYTFTFVDESGGGETTQLIISDRLKNDMSYMSNLDVHNERYLIVLKKRNSYYPIYTINEAEFFKTLKPKCKTFIYDAKIIKVLYNMVMGGGRERREVNKMISLEFINKFIKANPAYSLKTLYINRRNLCYSVGLLIKKCELIVPIKYSAYIGTNIAIDFKPVNPTTITNTPKVLINYINDMNAYIENISCRILGKNRPEDTNLYQKIIVDKHLLYNGSYSGFITNQKLIYYYAPCSKLPAVCNNWRVGVKKINYDIYALNSAILSNEPIADDNRTKLLGESLYTNYSYQLLVMELVNYLEKERGTKIRNSIDDLIKQTDFKHDLTEFYSNIKLVLAAHNEDLITIIRQISQYLNTGASKTALLDIINDTKYNFDKSTLIAIKSLPRKAARDKLSEVINKLVVKKDIDLTNIKFPNIYIPCEYGAADYCQGKKLVINGNLDELLDILINDILNPVKEKYLIGGIFSNNILNSFQFERHPNEDITIYRLLTTKPE